MIAIVQSISIISPLNPGTAIAPLVFVIAVSMIREAIEDYIRYRSDKGKLKLTYIIHFIILLRCDSRIGNIRLHITIVFRLYLIFEISNSIFHSQ